jgi:hypothetical protein
VQEPRYLGSSVLYAGIDRLLRDLSGAGVAVAAATSKRRASAEIAAGLTGLSSHLDVLVTMEDTVVHKPDPEPLLLAVNRLGATPDQAVYVGDAIVDVQDARNAGNGSGRGHLGSWGARGTGGDGAWTWWRRRSMTCARRCCRAEPAWRVPRLRACWEQTQAADSPRDIAKPITTSGPVKTFSTLYASGSSVSASIANSAPAAKASISAPVRPPAGSSTA